MKVWITKYALTAGIQERELREPSKNGGFVKLNGLTMYFDADDWRNSREDAAARAEHMRVAKIASLEKQIARLKALKFE